MEIRNEEKQSERIASEEIRKKVLKLERDNYMKKPDGLNDRQMEENIRKIIEQEIRK